MGFNDVAQICFMTAYPRHPRHWSQFRSLIKFGFMQLNVLNTKAKDLLFWEISSRKSLKFQNFIYVWPKDSQNSRFFL